MEEKRIDNDSKKKVMNACKRKMKVQRNFLLLYERERGGGKEEEGEEEVGGCGGGENFLQGALKKGKEESKQKEILHACMIGVRARGASTNAHTHTSA